VTLAEATRRLAGRGEAAELAVLVDGLGDPVDAGIATDGLVRGVDQDDLEELVGRVLNNNNSNKYIGPPRFFVFITWLIQYELRTRKLPQTRPTRSSATERRLRVGLSWFTPCVLGLP